MWTMWTQADLDHFRRRSAELAAERKARGVECYPEPFERTVAIWKERGLWEDRRKFDALAFMEELGHQHEIAAAERAVRQGAR